MDPYAEEDDEIPQNQSDSEIMEDKISDGLIFRALESLFFVWLSITS